MADRPTLEANGLLRKEDERLVTGHGRYAADCMIDGSLHAHVLRSDRAHAIIRSIDSNEARATPGVRLVFTGDDLRAAGARPQQALHARSAASQRPLLSPDFYPLAIGRVRYVGEAVVMVVADSADDARRAAAAVAIDYDDLEPVVDAEAALEPGVPQLFDHIPGNLAFDYRCGDDDAVECVIAGAAHVTRITVDSRRLVGNPMEPRAATVRYDPDDGCWDVWAPVQTPGTVRQMLADAWGLDPARVRLHVQDVGGGFGLRTLAYPEYRAMMHAARVLGRPVRWVATRSESFFADSHGRAMKFTGTLALDAEHRFLAMRFDAVCNMGAFLLPVAPHIMTLTPERGMAGAYRTPAIAARFRLALTNTAPVSAYRGAGRPDMAYAIERLVDAAAFELGIDRIELRRRNLIRDFPYTTPLGYCYDGGDLAGILERALDAADWPGFEARRQDAARRGRMRGIGLSLFVEVAGNSITENDSARVCFEPDGRVVLHCETQSSGQSHDTVFRDLMSGALGLPREAIEFRPVDASHHVFGAGSYASRTTQVVGHLLMTAASKVLERARERLSIDWAVPASEIRWEDRRLCHGGRSESVLELAARLHGPSPHPLDVRTSGVPAVSFPNGAHVAEVEVDPETGRLSVCDYVAVDDVGVVQNHAVVVGQVRGGVVQGAGQVFGEEAIYDENGQLLNASFADYFMPRAGIVPTITVIDHPVPCTTNALGAKGVGEAGVTGSVSSLMNAVVDALRPAGVRHIDPPATPHKIWQALQVAAGREPAR